jgi:hypothetical protein
MAIVNRTKDASEQRLVFQEGFGAVATGVTQVIAHVANSGVLEAAQIAAFGLSGSPTYALVINRFIVGTGATAITVAVGTSNTPGAFGTSGSPTAGMKLEASGSTLLNLLPNDVIMVQSGVANTAATGLVVSLVIRPTQDIRSYFGLV